MGYCVIDENGKLFKINRKGDNGNNKRNSLWGVRTFKSGEPAKGCRINRSTRRRYSRTHTRILELRKIMSDMVCKVDENFFARLDESFLWKEDKSDKAKSDYILFADKDCTDKDYYEKYQTIYHLRKHLLGTTEKADARFIYLALHHMLKYRGNFLYEGQKFTELDDFKIIYEQFLTSLKEYLEIECNYDQISCEEIEEKLKETCDIPIFHDDQHGTAVVTLAALLNALKLTGKKMEEIKVVTSGAGAAGIAIIKLLIAMGLKNVILCDRKGAIYEGREGLNKEKEEMAKITNRNHEAGTLEEVLKGADVFIGVSAPGCVTQDMVRSMNENPILFPMANPTPEIMPDLAKEAGAAVVGTGRSDFPNQINNVLAFPGIFRGALDVRASEINDEMKIAAAKAIASFVTDDLLSADYIIPSALDKNVATAVAEAVAKVAKETGVARI